MSISPVCSYKTSATSSNLFNNIVKYINGKYIDSRNKKIISININTKIDGIYINRNKKKSTKKKLCTNNSNNTNNINSQNFNNNINLYDFETQNNKDFDLSKKIKKIKKFIIFNKSINNIHSYANKVKFNKPFMEKSFKNNQILNLKNANSSRNLYINTYKKINVNFKEKKTLDNNNKFCYSSRNFGRNDKNNNKLVFNFSQSKLNISNKSKYKSKDNSYNNKNIKLKNDKIDDIRKNSLFKKKSLLKGSFISNSKKDLLN